MAKFGELIESDVPVLVDFYKEWERDKVKESQNQETIRDVAAALGDKAKIITIDVDKNEVLASALKVIGYPTYVVFKQGQMKWRQVGDQDANTLISIVQQYLK